MPDASRSIRGGGTTVWRLTLACAAMLVPSAGAAGPLDDQRASCSFQAGTTAEASLGAAASAPFPIDHIVIVMQENRSYDHYFGTLHLAGQPDSDGWPVEYSNLDHEGQTVRPHHLGSTCLQHSPPHQSRAMAAAYNDGKMDGFVKNGFLGDKKAAQKTAAAAKKAAAAGKKATHKSPKVFTPSDGHYALGYYDSTDLPFYHWLASTWATSDRHFASTMAGTWPNRAFLYTAASGGLTETLQPNNAKCRTPVGTTSGSSSNPFAVRSKIGKSRYCTLANQPTIFSLLSRHWVSWGVFKGDYEGDGALRQDVLGWNGRSAGVHGVSTFLRQLRAGTLPNVSFVDPGGGLDEHPPENVQDGEAFARKVYETAVDSPLWPRMAIIYTYDEGGALGDHVPPPVACPATSEELSVTRLGFRVPLIVVSPYARKHHVSHVVTEHTSILRLVEAIFKLPALTGRDANAEALLDLFDFSRAPMLGAPDAPQAGSGGCEHPSDGPDEYDEDDEEQEESDMALAPPAGR